MLSSLCERDVWIDNGGDVVTGRLVGGSLLIQAPARIHEQIERVLEMLRADADETRHLAAEEAQRAEREREEEIQMLATEMESLKEDIRELAVRSEQLEIQQESTNERYTSAFSILRQMRLFGRTPHGAGLGQSAGQHADRGTRRIH